MDLIRGDILKTCFQPTPLALTFGNFDGLHLGHQSLIESLKSAAHARQLKTAVFTLNPHPRSLLSREKFYPLQSCEDKIERFKALGVNTLFLQEFNTEFAQIDAENFLRQYVLEFIKPQLVFFGYDFRFGKGGKGDFELAQSYLSTKGIELIKGQAFKVSDQIVSSTQIRQALIATQVEKASELLGFPYKISGTVIEGLKIGRQLGFPTANLSLPDTLLPGKGVYAGRALVDKKKYSAVLNIGTRPTLDQDQKTQVECHILNFKKEIYSQKAEFEFHFKLRDEIKFSSLDQLKKQIAMDVSRTQKLMEPST